ncbi:DNA phosphorothioation-dependent restriction protein DptH [Paenibacillus sp.]|uniref:DNA phosphorothioation-dependent restriction protein DptH n=1 Tax=Paenibacillus sp. TaxID=58172 RepID=UPI002D34A008|nr:DNA phosphorothioation-dependent restriction protein DptH [Paenibacillus sp.]HZG86237.1 DNA phosphorothioation-dependent restriction protein DptH [Paenibacillus sp.]
MSNPFFKKIAEMLFQFFQRELNSPGERYYLQLDHENDVEEMAKALHMHPECKPFVYQHQYGEAYTTFAIPINGIDLVVAYTSNTVKPDFLVTLRNQVGEQKGEWESTALLSIVSSQLDSIQGGSSDLSKEGMPLHAHSIVAHLKHEIENSVLSKVEQLILLDRMELTLQEQMFQQITIFDFEEIFRILEVGSIQDEDYKALGLFKDAELDTFKGNKLKERLDVNRELFDFVKNIHDFGLDFEELDKKFAGKGREKLEGEDWAVLPFSEILKSKQEHDNSMKAQVDLKAIKYHDKTLLWDKPVKETKAGTRKRHILLFNPGRATSVQLSVSFLLEGEVKSLHEKFLRTSGKEVITKVGKTNLQIEIQGTDQCVFTKVDYKHNNKSALGAELHIAVIPLDPTYFENYRAAYSVNVKGKYISIQFEGSRLLFGQGSEETLVDVNEDGQTVTIPSERRLVVQPQPDAFADDETLRLQLAHGNTAIPIKLVNELPESIPITGSRIWKLKRESQRSFEWKNNRLMLGNREFYMHGEDKQFFDWEMKWIEEGYKSATYMSGNLVRVNVELDEDLREAYSRFVNQFLATRNIPSLTHYTDEMVVRAKEYLKAYTRVIESFKENKEAGERGRSLFKLGVIRANNVIYFTPFHPLLVAYQLQLNELLGSEEVDSNILNRLRPDALLPFLYDEEDRLYKPEPQTRLMEWMVYKPVSQVSVSDANKYLAKVIEDKLHQFEEHFGYLLAEGSKAPVKINLIHIENDTEVLRGIIQWMLRVIERKGIDSVHALELTLYRGSKSQSAFDLFSRVATVEELQEKFEISLSSKQYDAADLLRTIRTKLTYYKQEENHNYKYAHISFYKMLAQEKDALQPMNEMVAGVALEGLYSFVPAMKSEENYRSGFGVKGYKIEAENVLMNTVYYLNEIAANLRNGGNDAYRKAEAIFSRTTTADEKTLEAIFNASYWVTFVDSNIDLEFFHSFKNLVVIHYSDQYSTTSKYDAITVTDKSAQYYAVIKDVLSRKQVEVSHEGIQNTVKAFNTFNGEWLLRIIGSKGHFTREKLSIISAIKFSLAFFDHPHILWVPISLEEILRVAGAVSLNKSEGVFSAKNLGVTGAHSDDLLLVGLEDRGNKLKMHFYPVEVKIGINNGAVIGKAKDQVHKTKKVIIDALTNSNMPFTSMFYRYFFAQLFITNAQKLHQSEFWPEKPEYLLPIEYIEKLLKDDFAISDHVNSLIGDGAVLSFEKAAYVRSSSIEDGITYITLPEADGYNILTKSMESTRTWIQYQDNDFIRERMLSSLYRINQDDLQDRSASDRHPESTKSAEHQQDDEIGSAEESEEEQTETIEETLTDPTDADDGESLTVVSPITEEGSATSNIAQEEPETGAMDEVSVENIRLLIGKAENSERKIYWEYGHAELANRHFLISGKSGQGKTYLIQCLLLELSKKGISSLVVDYTEGFLPNQLEPEFIEHLGPKLIQRVVFNDKFPMNPFRKNIRNIGGITLPEGDTDVAERVRSIFASVYKSLGIQQLNAIYDAVLRGLSQYGDQFTLQQLRQELESDGSTYAKTALSQIRPFIDRDPFTDGDPINWGDILHGTGEVYIIQLTGYPREVQLILTEFVLWDLWNYSIRTGNKMKPIPIVLDEAQNLDHSENSPTTKILTEGRKFGWSGWFATQFLKAQLGNDELARLQNSSQKLYFAQPEQEISYIAGNLANDPTERKKVEQLLSNLRKGQCVFNGPILKDGGSLSAPTVTVVNITPLKDRI